MTDTNQLEPRPSTATDELHHAVMDGVRKQAPPHCFGWRAPPRHSGTRERAPPRPAPRTATHELHPVVVDGARGRALTAPASPPWLVSIGESPPPRACYIHGKPVSSRLKMNLSALSTFSRKNEVLKMMWMAKTELILQFNDIYGISGFVMANPGLMKFTMAYNELPPK
jgi:hypothetical protein